MVVITRSGALVRATPEIKTALRVRPLANDDFGFPPPAFSVYRKASDGKVCVPRYFDWGSERVTEDKRPEPTRVAVRFVGRLRASTNQLEAYDSALRAGHGILALPCGFGKTVLALALSARLGYRTMIIVHKEFLANQWRERIAEFCPGARVGVVQQNKKEIDGCDYVIAMLQSLSMKEYSFSDFDSIGTVIIDEAHHICARTFSQSLFKLCPRHIFGLSATPERKDGLTRVLKWFCGDIVYSAERKAQKGVEVYNVSFDHSSFRDPPPTMRNGKVSLSTMITSLTEIRERNARLVEIVREASRGTRKVLVLSDRRRHCEFLAQCFPTDSGLYMGGMKAQDLQESSTKKIIIATYSLAHEGLDIPALDTVVLSTPKSDIVQSIGRIMRETKGKKNNPRIYDFKDEWGLLGAMHWKRLKVYRQSGFTIHSGGGPAAAARSSPFEGKFAFKNIDPL